MPPNGYSSRRLTSSMVKTTESPTGSERGEEPLANGSVYPPGDIHTAADVDARYCCPRESPALSRQPADGCASPMLTGTG